MMAMLQHKNPARGHEIYNFGRPFLGHNNYTLSLSETCPGVEKIFKKYLNFTFFFTPKWIPLGVGFIKLTISCLLTLKMVHTKFGKVWPSSSWEEDVNR